MGRCRCELGRGHGKRGKGEGKGNMKRLGTTGVSRMRGGKGFWEVKLRLKGLLRGKGCDGRDQ